MTSIVDADSILAVDFGSATTRAILFDAVSGQYRFVAAGTAPTTAEPPYLDVGEGLRRAIDQLREISGRQLLDESQRLIMPSRSDGSGVDAFVATASAGPAVRAVIAGLMPDASLESVRHLAASTYLTVVDEIDLGDRRKPEQQIDSIVAARPDLIIVAGGTEAGASDAVLKMVETLGLAAYLLPMGHKPQVLFAGNTDVGPKVVETLRGIAEVRTASNIRPGLDEEDLVPARAELAKAFESLRAKQVNGFGEVAAWAGGHVIPTAQAFGQVIRFLSRVYDPGKGVMGVDIGATSTTVAASWVGELFLTVRPDLGLGLSAPNVLDHLPIEKIMRWLPVEVLESQVRDYIHNKGLYPRSIPMDATEIHIEHALTRQVLRTALGIARRGWPARPRGSRPDQLPWFEPILASGAAFAQTAKPGRAALVLLDALQPTGITTLVLDPYGLAPALGAAAAVNPLATVQVLESGSFVNLGTVISPVGRARFGEPILNVKVTPETGDEVRAQVRHGSLERLPLPMGRSAKVTLSPLHRFDVGLGGPGRGGTIKVTGGALGLIVDARGRPVALPSKPDKRQELNQKWLWDLGG